MRHFRCIAAIVSIMALFCASSLAASTAVIPSVPEVGSPAPADGPMQALAQIRERFQDLDHVSWALLAIEKLTLSGVIQGYGDGTFRPGNQITRTEALTMALRLMGNNDLDAQVAADEVFPATLEDFEDVPGWARGYVGLGIAADLIPAEGTFAPAAPALRNWAAMLLVRAAGLEAEAQAQMGEIPDFTDAADIPEGFRGYITVAVANGLLRGFPDGSVQPNAAITRAQMAALMERAEEMVQARHGVNAGRRFTGTVTEKGDLTVTLEHEGLNVTTYTLATEVSIYLRDVPGNWDDVWVDDKVQLRLNEDGEVVLIEIKAEQEEAEGTVVSVTDGNIAITLDDETHAIFALSANVVVRLRGEQVELEVVMAGDRVELKIVHDEVWTIVVDEQAEVLAE